MIDYKRVRVVFQVRIWLSNAWQLFRKKPLTWIFMVLIFNVFVIVSSSFAIGRIVLIFLLPVFAGGIYIALDKANRDEPIALENLFSAFKDKPVLKQLLIVGAIGVAVSALKMILQYLTGTDYELKLETSEMEGAENLYEQVSEGSIFTGILTWIWTWALFFGIPLVAVKREAAIPALRRSLAGIFANIIPLFVFLVVTVLLTVVSVIPFGLGLLVLIPILFGASYFAFDEIYVVRENSTESALSDGLGATGRKKIEHEKTEEESQAVVHTNVKAHQEADLKATYKSIRVFTMVGVALVAIGAVVATYTFYSLQVGTTTMGEVVSSGIKRGGGSNSSISYQPVFSFTDMLGRQYTAPTSYSSSGLKYPVGARVKISYNPDDVSTVQVHSVKSVLYIPLFFWFFGGLTLWCARAAKKNVDENGVPPRQSVFLQQEPSSGNEIAELNDSELINASGNVHVDSEAKQNSRDTTNKEDDMVELVLPRKMSLDRYDGYLHITLSWLGKKTVRATVFAVVSIGLTIFILFSSVETSVSSPLVSVLVPLVGIVLAVSLLYNAIASCINKSHILVSQDAIEVKHLPLPWSGSKRLAAENIKQLYSKREVSRSSSNNRTSVHYSLRVISFDEEDITLLKVENSTQALFLEQEIEKFLGIENLRVRGEIE